MELEPNFIWFLVIVLTLVIMMACGMDKPPSKN